MRNHTSKKRKSRSPSHITPETSQNQVLLTLPPPISVSEFDSSVENYLKFVDTITKLYLPHESLACDQSEIDRFSNSITFLREWKDFFYAPRTVRFSVQNNSEEKNVIGGITLSQFSSAAVPKQQNSQHGSKLAGAESSKDFVMYVGGAVWALDWCPEPDHNPEKRIETEFVAVAAHPPESSYHKLGAPLTGRGVVQIWCVLTASEEYVLSHCNKKKIGTQRKTAVMTKDPNKPKRPRGRPRKKPLNISSEKVHTDSQFVQPLTLEYPEDSSATHSVDGIICKDRQQTGITPKECNLAKQGNSSLLITPKDQENQENIQVKSQVQNHDFQMLIRDENQEPYSANPGISPVCCVNSLTSPEEINSFGPCDGNTPKYGVPKDIALPRMILCLAHNGKVAWDVKWRPLNGSSSSCLKRMGYLAVVLGNGALEVWEVPLPHTMKLLHSNCEEQVDPRFIKLQPVFRCSILKCSDRQSIPLTVEWSVASPCDLILVGCHDGVVALWKFSVTDPSKETRPLLSFSADTGPIRALAWAPNEEGDIESSNIVVTAGRRGLKFWDIRDPFRPLWDHPILGVAYSLEWLPDPRCIFGSIDDGTLWLLNLIKTPSDIPISKKNLSGTKTGIHCIDCSPFSIWSVHASRLTGMVAYCGEEGTTFCFQPTTRTVNDPSRYRLQHYLCGSLSEEGSSLTVVSSDSPSVNRYPSLKRGSTSTKNQDKRTMHSMIEGQSDKSQAPLNELAAEMNVEKLEQFEVFPAKIVAMHRVRWNLNKGSKKWICYGGAGGLVRCQEIDTSEFD